MEFELSAEQREIKSLAREFAEAEIEPHAAEWDRELLGLRAHAKVGA
jgi:alkylation response protein AidB-like acyl-CoA dehydrogenase